MPAVHPHELGAALGSWRRQCPLPGPPEGVPVPGAEHVARLRQPDVGGYLGQAEVRYLDVAVRIEQQVGRLDVAVNDARLMRIIQRIGRLCDNAGDRALAFPDPPAAAR